MATEGQTVPLCKCARTLWPPDVRRMFGEVSLRHQGGDLAARTGDCNAITIPVDGCDAVLQTDHAALKLPFRTAQHGPNIPLRNKFRLITVGKS